MANRTLVKEKSDKVKFIEDIVLAVSTPKSEIVDIQSDWEEEPVSLEVFCTDYLEEALFPLQQKFGSELLGSNGYEFDEKYTDGLAFWGKGSGKDKGVTNGAEK